MAVMQVIRYVLMGAMGVTSMSILLFQGIAFAKAFMSLHH